MSALYNSRKVIKVWERHTSPCALYPQQPSVSLSVICANGRGDCNVPVAAKMVREKNKMDFPIIRCGIQGVPSRGVIVLWKGKVKNAEVQGAKPPKIRPLVDKCA